MHKSDARRHLRALRRSLPDAQRLAAHTGLQQHLMHWLDQRHARPHSIALWWPLADEPDLRPLFAPLHEQGFQVLLPRVVSRHAPLAFQRWTPQARMEPGAYGIAVPVGTDSVALQSDDLVLVPCIGFDRSRRRVGAGGGFYDRTLAAARAAQVHLVTVGVAYAAGTLFSPMHWESHDEPLAAILTEEGWLDGATPDRMACSGADQPAGTTPGIAAPGTGAS